MLTLKKNDKKLDFKVIYPRTYVDFDLNGNVTKPSLTIVVKTGANCVEANVSLTNTVTNESRSMKTQNCVAISDSGSNTKFSYSINAPGFIPLLGTYEQKMNVETLTVELKKVETQIIFKLTDSIFKALLSMVEGELVCGANSIKQRSDVFGNLVFPASIYKENDTCLISIKDSRFQPVSEVYPGHL